MNGAAQALRIFDHVSDGLQAEMDLLLAPHAAHGTQSLVWRTSQSLVVPASFAARPGFGEAVDASKERGWPVASRATGGGTTPQGQGILNVCLAFSPTSRPSIHAAYRRICMPLQRAFEELGMRTTCQAVPGSFCDGEFNIVHRGQKLVGTAQRWRPPRSGGGHRILVHALILQSANVREVVQAINAFHQDLGLDVPVHQHTHTTVEAAGRPMSEVSFAELLTRHINDHDALLEHTTTDLTPTPLRSRRVSEAVIGA